MKWKKSPVIKIYEALGAVADGRVEVDENTAKVYSSSRSKFYEVQYDAGAHSVMANDNGSYWKGYLGYPSIAYLLATGVLEHDASLASLMKDIAWKDLNQKFRNDFDKTLTHILSVLSPEDRKNLEVYTAKLEAKIETLHLSILGKKTSPPEGY